MASTTSTTSAGRIATGIAGLDEILRGGLIDRRGYLIRGGPGCGKTTVGMHFLSEGARQGEAALFITLGEAAANLRANAAQVGIDIEGIEILDLSPESDFFADTKTYDLFTPAEVERDPVTKKIIDCVRRVKPRRVFLDSTSHLRYLSIDAYQFRKQLMSFIRFLLEQRCVVLYTSEGTAAAPDDDVMYISDGVINLALADATRSIEVTKFRGSDFHAGTHTFSLTGRGARVYPRLVPAEHAREFDPEKIGSGVSAIDRLLHGGVERGTVTLLTGPAGVGKSTLAMQFARQAAFVGTKTAFLTFEESIDSLVYRAQSIGIPLRDMIEAGALNVMSIEPLVMTADQIAALIRREVEGNGCRLIVIDGVTGFGFSVAGDVRSQLRGLFKYLTNMGVTSIAVNETEAITGDFRATEIGISYMADNIVFLRYLELRGEMRKAIGVLKKRLGDFERHLREFAITRGGVVVGEPLTKLRGILNGVPEWTDHGQADEPLRT